jgi:hypothetical protein
MKRRLFLLLAPVGLWGWRWHLLARHECAGGGLLMLVLRGEPWKLTERERELVDLISDKMNELEPQSLQRRLPKS